MHVGIVLPSFSLDDELQIPSISLLVTALSNHHQVTVVPLRNPPGIAHRSTGGLNVVDTGGSGRRFRTLLQDSIGVLRRLHQEQPFDLLHGYWLFESGFVAATAARLLGIPSVASIGGAELVDLPEIGYGGLRSRRGKLLNLGVLRAATLVTGGSSYVLDLAQQALPSSAPKLRLAPLPVDATSTGQGIPEAGKRASATRLLQVGAYLPVKGHDLSIRALGHLRDSHPDLRLTLIGEDPHGRRTRLADLAAALELSGHVDVFERIPHDALDACYRGSDLLLMPSRHESQGMVVLEAATQGLPTLGSSVGVVRDLAPDAAVAIPLGDAATLAHHIAALIDDPERRRTIGRAARTAVVERYGIEPATRRWIEIYREATNGDS